MENDNAVTIYGVSRLTRNLIRQSGYTFAGFVKLAILEKLERLNLSPKEVVKCQIKK